MTRPLYVACMRKIRAIITDRGGILCHAAMVAREFRLPCVVNTKNATKKLKNGQKIIVDANKGIIYEA
jgi:pyruvate,water dikinase